MGTCVSARRIRNPSENMSGNPADSGHTMMVRESEMGGELLSSPKYYWGCCMVCKKAGTSGWPLKRCAGCSAAFYCSKEHQKSNWKQHKRICTYMRAAAEEVGAQTFFGQEFVGFPGLSGDGKSRSVDGSNADDDEEVLEEDDKTASWKSWASFRMNAAKTCQVILTGGSGKLEEWEKEMFLFPRACRVCRLAKSNAMYDCPECMCVSYCSALHKNEDSDAHAQFCNELKYGMVCDVYESTVSIAAPAIASTIDAKFNREKFLKHDMKSFLLDQVGWSRTSSLYQKKKKYRDVSDFDTEEMDFRFLSDRLSGPLTILYGCLSMSNPELANGVSITESRDLTVHIVGCNVVEMLGIIKWEYLSHRLPKLENYRVVFVGPELADQGETENGECKDISACNACMERNKSLVYEVRPLCYQDYVEKGKAQGHYTQPDVVVAFNCGFHEFKAGSDLDTWTSGIKYLVHEVGVPCIFTSYTATEASKDVAFFKRALASAADDVIGQNSALNGDVTEVNFETIAAKNPYRSHRPVRDFELDNNCDVFYSNQYLTVARRTYR